jgi:hypothetical protein
MVRRLAVLAFLTVSSAVLGAASSLGLASDGVGATTVATGRCTTAGLAVLQTLTATSVTSVSVGVLPAACAGGVLRVAVNNGATSSEGTATIPGGGGTVSVTLAVPVAVTLAEQTDVVVSGP